MVTHKHSCAQKNGPLEAGRRSSSKKRLLDFVFFIYHVLAHDWIVLLELQLVRRGLFVLVGGVVVTGIRGRHQFDFVTHRLNLVALGAQLRKY